MILNRLKTKQILFPNTSNLYTLGQSLNKFAVIGCVKLQKPNTALAFPVSERCGTRGHVVCWSDKHFVLNYPGIFNAYLAVGLKWLHTKYCKKKKKKLLQKHVDRGLLSVLVQARICVKLMGLQESEISWVQTVLFTSLQACLIRDIVLYLALIYGLFVPRIYELFDHVLVLLHRALDSSSWSWLSWLKTETRLGECLVFKIRRKIRIESFQTQEDHTSRCWPLLNEPGVTEILSGSIISLIGWFLV